MVNLSDCPDCTNHCKSHQHGEIITSAISKRGVSDTDLCAFLNYTCCRCESVTDYSGRTALHVAASCGRLHLVKWLVCNRGADIDAKDKESGYTALHRSIFYGQIHVAVELVKLGASVHVHDQESLTALEHAMKDGLKPNSSHGDLFYWGSNNNNIFGSVQARDVPDLLDFHKHYPGESITKICIEQFHIVLLTLSGNIYSCGHGRDGRLGLGNEGSYVVPQMLKISNAQKEEPVLCIDVDISRDHSIFLFSDKSVYTCGLNQYMVLGHMPPPDRLLAPKPLKNFTPKGTVGICARRYHSLAWNATSVYAWGLNAGQFGTKSRENTNQLTVTPKKMHIISDIKILTVGASDGATVVVTYLGTIYVFHEYQCKKIASKQTNVLKVCVLGGNLDSKLLVGEKHKENKELKVAVLLNTGDVFLWQESDQQLCRCVYSNNRVVIVKHMFLNKNELLLVSEYGEGFKGFIKPRKKKKVNQNDKTPKSTEKEALSRFLEKDDCIYVVLEKIPKIHRAFFVQSDLKGKDYSILQVHPYRYDVNTHQSNSEMTLDLKKFLEMTISDDGVADINFKLKNGSCAAHRYILLNKCSNFDNKLTESVAILPEVDCFVFQQFLMFVYTGDCDFLLAHQIENSFFQNKKLIKNDTDNTDPQIKIKESTLSPIDSLRKVAKEFGCTSLLDQLKKSSLNSINDSKEEFVFKRCEHEHLHDITLKCTDGEVNAHKCILSARMEYFGNMLSNRWSGNEVTVVNLSFPKRTVELLLDFLYTDSLPSVTDIDIDNLLKLLILADQFFVAKLKELCEIYLSEKMTFKNTVEILSFAHMYNANKLKNCCIQFITLNMPTFLDLGYLNDLQIDILGEISLAYFKEKNLSYRVITPHSEAVSDEVLISIANKYPVLTTVLENKPVLKSEQKKKTRPHRISLSKKEKISSLEKETIVENDVLVVKTVINNNDFNTIRTSDSASKRMTSISKATEMMKSENIAINYVKLNPNDSSSSLENSFIDSNDFPELGSSFSNSENLTPKNFQQKNESRHKMVKMSQKQRKKLNSESDDGLSKSVTETKKSPWKTNFDFGSPISSPEGSIFTMTDIISNEKKQKENLVKITNKLLLYTQMEDRAIEELNKFYNVEETLDEVISIERVDTGAIAKPLWVPKTK